MNQLKSNPHFFFNIFFQNFHLTLKNLLMYIFLYILSRFLCILILNPLQINFNMINHFLNNLNRLINFFHL
jgi:hypothetical protein